MVLNAGFENFKITWRADVFSDAPQHSSAELFGTIGINFFASKPKTKGKLQKILTFVQNVKNLSLKRSNRKNHWENVHQNKLPNELSWYEAYPEISLTLIKSTGVEPSGNIIDVGGGTSKLVDILLVHGYERITVLDISASAIKHSKERLKEQAHNVKWIETDITEFKFSEEYDIWHDRAVFHFLTDADDRKKYINTLKQSLKIGGYFIIGTFAIDGPEKCSGLDVMRYSSETLHKELGNDFELLELIETEHITPTKVKQKFIYCCFRRRA